MTPSPAQDVAPPPVMTSDQIMQHVDSVYSSLPDPVRQALDHAHTLTGGSPGSSVQDATTAPPQAQPGPSFPSLGMIAGPPSQAASMLAHPPATGQSTAPAPVMPSEAPALPPTDQEAVSIPGASELSSIAPPPVEMGGIGAGEAKPPSASGNPQPAIGPLRQAANALASEKSGIGQIHNPWLRVPAAIGEGLINAFVPGGHAFTSFVPGFQSHHNMLVNQAEKAATGEETGAKSAADVAHTGAETGLENAQAAGVPAETALKQAETQNYLSEAEARKNPDLQVVAHPVVDPNDPEKIPRTGYFNKKTGVMSYGPEIAAAPASQQRTSFEKMDDGTVLALSVKPDGTPTHTVVYKGDPKLATEIKQLEVGGKPHQVLFNAKTGEQIKDLGETGEKPPTVNVNAETSALDRESARFGKTHEANVKAANDQLEKIIEARSMLTTGNAESQAAAIPKVMTALVSGQGTGVRITQPELNAIGNARGIAGDVQGWIQKLGTGKKLTPEQSSQLVGLLDSTSQRLEQKRGIANDALDKINSGGSRADIVKADADARKTLADFEKGGAGGGQQKVSTKAEYDALPKGAKYVDAHGIAGTKK